ncbi:MAG TPA: fibronectin type III domain-containing protein [Candidatus Limnocylindrales bacterium]|nr:fibronectin type III domain-containing protein [Candidatus Limnocylindrales bacterium]
MFRTLAFGVIAPLMLLVAAPSVMAASPAQVQLEGTLELVHGEDFDTGTSVYEYRLRTDRETVRLSFDGDAPAGFLNGARVRVHGHRPGTGSGTFAADGGTSSGTVLMSAPGSTGSRRLAVVLINFSNNTTKPFTRSFVNGVVFTNSNSVRAYFAEESGGAMQLTGTTFDWLRIPVSNTTCDFGAWEAAGRAGLAGRGVDLSAYTNFMFVFPQSNSCAWRGLGYLPGTTTWLNGTPSLRTTAHELAHNFGVHHASSLRCTSGGVRVALSSTCTRSEYGDPFTTMGAASTRHNDGLARVQMGYLPPSATRTITASGTYTLVKSFAASGVKVIGIPRGDGSWLYLDYRRPYGTYFDNFSTTSGAVSGVAIRLAQGWTTITQSSLIDTVPSTSTFADAPLRSGRTFKDNAKGITITVTALSASAATVAIKLPPDTVAPTAPGSVHVTATTTSTVSLAWTAATDNRAVTGYRIARDGTILATTAASATAWTDTGLAGATSYSWTVRAVDGAGNVGPASTATATTATPDAAPSAVSNLSAAMFPTVARLSWGVASDDHGVTGYAVSQDGVLLTTITTRSLIVEDLTPGTTYTWTVRAVDTIGQLGNPSAIQAATPLPDLTAPTSVVLSVVPANKGWAVLDWTAGTDDVAVAIYRVYREGALYATVDATTQTLRVPAGSTYHVTAVDRAANESEASNDVAA